MSKNIQWSDERSIKDENISLARLRDLYKMPWASMEEIQIEAERRQKDFVSKSKIS